MQMHKSFTRCTPHTNPIAMERFTLHDILSATYLVKSMMGGAGRVNGREFPSTFILLLLVNINHIIFVINTIILMSFIYIYIWAPMIKVVLKTGTKEKKRQKCPLSSDVAENSVESGGKK